jgi:hypothetical protein
MATKKETEDYNSIHWWIRRKYGSASRCDFDNCDGTSTTYEWALVHGMEYERKIDNFIQLCRKCHFSYDLREPQKKSFDAGRLLAQKKRIGMKHSKESLRKMSENRKGITAWNKGRAWSDETKKKMSLAGKDTME